MDRHEGGAQRAGLNIPVKLYIGLVTVVALGTIGLAIGVVDEPLDWIVAGPAMLAAVAAWLLIMTEGI